MTKASSKSVRTKLKAKRKGKTKNQPLPVHELMADHVDKEDWDSHEMLSSDESSDEGCHGDLIADITTQLSSRRKGTRHEASLTVSDYNLDPGKQVAVSDLIGSLDKTKDYAELNKKMKLSEHQLEQPLPTHQVDKLQRAASYKEASHELSRWQPIVKKNREADHLVFPLQKSSEIDVPNVNSLVTSFQPRTPLEVEIAGLLKNSEAATVTSEGLTVAEQKALEKMNVEEAKQRRRELQKMRALITYQEKKFRREKRIKSKKFHKMQRKAKKQSKPEGDIEKADKLRAKERMTLKHSSKSKWASRIASRNHKDSMTRQAVTEQRQLGRDLKQKITQMEDEPSSSDGEEQNELGEGLLLESSDNPWMKQGNLSVDTDDDDLGGRQNLANQSLQNLSTPTSSLNKPDQLQHIKAAFADDDLMDDTVQEFVRDKELEVEKSTAKNTMDDLDLPGWGSWAGQGAPAVSKKQPRPSRKRIRSSTARKDANLKHVIIKEARDSNLCKHQVKNVTHPFTSIEQYEATQRVPVGRLWNSEDSYHNMIRPRVTVVTGEVIPPLEATEEIEGEFNHYNAQKELVKKIMSRKRKHK